jgi:type II secretory pathway component GspD/PulD (secretin)
MRNRLGRLLLLAGLFALTGPAPAQTEPAAKARRTVYVVKHGAAKDLANVLGKHFKDDAEVQVLPDAPSNCLLISAPPAVFDEVVKVLDQLDRRPHAVSVEVLVAELAPKKAEGDKTGAADKELDESEFTGPADQVLARVEGLQKKGQVQNLRRIQLTAIENQPGSAAIGETKPVVTAVTKSATGHVGRIITHQPVGTMVRLTPRLTAEKQVQLDLSVEDNGVAFPEDGFQLGADENGKPILAADIFTASVKTKLDVPAGQAVAARDIKTTSKSGRARSLVIVTARVVEPDAESKK